MPLTRKIFEDSKQKYMEEWFNKYMLPDLLKEDMVNFDFPFMTDGFAKKIESFLHNLKLGNSLIKRECDCKHSCVDSIVCEVGDCCFVCLMDCHKGYAIKVCSCMNILDESCELCNEYF
jgi:hypothetical protein